MTCSNHPSLSPGRLRRSKSPATKRDKTVTKRDIPATKADISMTNRDKISLRPTLKCPEMSHFVAVSGPFLKLTPAAGPPRAGWIQMRWPGAIVPVPLHFRKKAPSFGIGSLWGSSPPSLSLERESKDHALRFKACAKSVSKLTPPFALSWSKGHPLMVRPAHHERTLN